MFCEFYCCCPVLKPAIFAQFASKMKILFILLAYIKKKLYLCAAKGAKDVKLFFRLRADGNPWHRMKTV